MKVPEKIMSGMRVGAAKPMAASTVGAKLDNKAPEINFDYIR